MPGRPWTRVPLEPLLEHVKARLDAGEYAQHGYNQHSNPRPVGTWERGWSLVRAADYLGVNPCRFAEWRHKGGIPLHIADRLAVAVGCHPNELWPGWDRLPFYADQEEADPA